ncbi:acyl-CoA dehydrogenase family protein [Azohydromonas caseinilytica]|uniref:Acyl-CoA dehydrogenase n=1 Tax=Azohydromonas caseinilytica TaxID=2728836 RepID=A0A848FC99_9BURK|nr:acyl-CoA dehydrogenase family protein [Azohydromonas caseinilytica]NML16385.1 acyl-CoA dehydrogenase [Azohydromonas caseinilytica]
MSQDALRDTRFVLQQLLQAPAVLAGLPAHAEVDAALIDQVAEAAHEFADGLLAPLNASGDREGCHLENGSVRAPTGFAWAWSEFVEGGWPLLACHPDDGGQGLPQVVEAVLHEAISAANPGWGMYFGILHGGYACLRAHGSEELKARYLGDLASGKSLVTMALTEPQAGSDLGLCRTRATPRGDGSVVVEGTKIFISGGDHDLTHQIVHLVLARLPDAPAGSRGLSLFLVPKWLPDGTRNAVVVERLEEKMGLHASPTCVLRFDGATGWLVGEPGRGLNAMFVMMNAARINVGLQGVGAAGAALAQAEDYATQRAQGGVPILRHAPVQRLLAQARAWTEGGRMLALWTALRLDQAHAHPDAAERERALREASLLTPIVKALLTDQGFKAVSDCLQVFGGHGYVSEWGIEQRLRDLRVSLLYEGTNEIQALDLWQRRLLPDHAQAFAQLTTRLLQDVASPWAAAATQAAERLLTALRNVMDADVPAGLAAPSALRGCGLVLLAALWARADAAAVGAADDAFHRRKRATAVLFFTQLLPELETLLAQLDALRADPRAAAATLALAAGVTE